MAQTYSTDLRVRFVRAVAAGTSARAAGRRFEIAPTTAIRWARVWRERGEHRARPRGRPPKGSKLDRHEGFLLALLEQQRDITLREAAELEGLTVHGPVTQGAFLTALGIGPRAEALARGIRSYAGSVARSGVTQISKGIGS